MMFILRCIIVVVSHTSVTGKLAYDCFHYKTPLSCETEETQAFSNCCHDLDCGTDMRCCLNGSCIRDCYDVRTLAGYCQSQKDCQASYCCVNRDYENGAKFGFCQKMGSISDDCYVSDPYTATPPAGIVKTCPCGFGNYCAGIAGKFDQFGQMGHCRSF
ncbi:uncharacterized protein LOC121372547 [Gigantopelta aegis]|uniref:uncharacterized protein LOC121372547 n=1 Tax=Gigantopelta aegis TaxID=1735272 RepID=UPI001B88958D|nr:uncharacterized protein LOC121372547 [Gigantopelta aegis]